MNKIKITVKAYGEEVKLTFSDGLDIYDFIQKCKALAACLGYHPDSIKAAFRDED